MDRYSVSGAAYGRRTSLPAGTNTWWIFTSITTYEISVKTADSDEYKVVATGDWANTAGWKTADFAPVENVTNIKLLAKAAKPTSWWAVAAEIRSNKQIRSRSRK